MRARYYNPDLKRFMNRDTVNGDIVNSQTLNRYAFVNGNPISYNDPFGLARESIASNGWMGNVHTVLDIAGMAPGIGVVPDLINAGLYLSEGNYEEALWSSVGAIPVVGDATSGVRNISKVSKLSNNSDKIVNSKKRVSYSPDYKHFTPYDYRGETRVAKVSQG